MWRRLLTPIVCLLLVHATLLHAPAQAAPLGAPLGAPTTPAPQDDVDAYNLPTAVSAPMDAFDAVGSETLGVILKARAGANQILDPDHADDYAKGLKRDLKGLEVLEKVSNALDLVEIGLDALPGAIRAWDAASSGDWREATLQAAGVVEMIGKGLLKDAVGTMAVNYATMASYAACAAFALGAPACIGLIVLARVGAGYASDAVIDAILEPFERPFCRSRRTGNGACEPSPILGPRGAAGPGGSGGVLAGAGMGAGPGGPSTGPASSAPGGGRYAGQGPPPAPGFTGGGGVKLGSTTTTVTAKNLTAGASGSGSSAVNNIGSISGGGGGGANVSAQSITTVAKGGQSATTNIGSGGGDTVVTGDTYNEGGDLTIGSGRTSRDGRTCIDVYRNTCIVRIYYRKHYSDPCAPGYWRVLNACKLPSDDKHSIPGL